MEERVKIKICGLSRRKEIAYVNRYRPDYAGFVFYPPSHRNVTPEQAEMLCKGLEPEILRVGVFAEMEPEQVMEIAGKIGLDVIQLHGGETEEELCLLRKMLGDRSLKCEIWKAYRIRSAADLEQAESSSADRILLDNGYGTGSSFNWELLEREWKRPFILAGGLNEENIEEAIQNFHPQIIDVSSGAETEGRKDEGKIKAVIEAVRKQNNQRCKGE